MKVLDLFSGLGGFSIGLEKAGMQTIGFCEIDPYCRAVLAKHWPEVPCHDDIRTFQPPQADIICGGFPCQDISLAGKRAGVSGSRSGLYGQMVRAIRLVRPRFAIMENVAALLGFGMGRVLGDVAEDGYDAEWDCISASDVGAPHGRDRVWITLADAYELQRSPGNPSSVRWWLWGQGEAEAASYPDSLRELQSPRFLGDIRRRIDNPASGGTWWARDWETEFAALRGMDDGIPDGLDKSVNAAGVRSLGNAALPQIPEILGRAIMAYV